MDKLVSFYTALVALLASVLQGEPLRVITYGGALVVWLVSNVAWAIGYQAFGAPVNFDVALLAATAAVVAVTEAERRFVFSPKTVAVILATVGSTPAPFAGDVPTS